MNQTGIVVIGNGNMANSLLTLCQENGRPYTSGLSEHASYQNMVAIHCGSGRQLPDTIKWCQKHEVPLIQASTGQALPDKVTVPVVDAPNLSLPIIKLLGVLPALREAFDKIDDVTITESHQASKTSAPGTAQVMASALGVPEEDIDSIRSPATQLQLGVPEEYLDDHAYHWITFRDRGVVITINAKVNGHRTYELGALAIADALISIPTPLEKRVYGIVEILKLTSL